MAKNCASKIIQAVAKLNGRPNAWNSTKYFNTVFYWETGRANVSNPVIAAKSDAVLQIAQELFALPNPTAKFSIGDDFSNKCNVMTPFLLSRFDGLNSEISSNETKFFVDDIPRAFNFSVFRHLGPSRNLDETLLHKFSRLEKFI